MKNRDLILYHIRLSEVKAIHIHDPTKLPDGAAVRNVMWRMQTSEVLPRLTAVPHQQGLGQPPMVEVLAHPWEEESGCTVCPGVVGGGLRGPCQALPASGPVSLPPMPAFPVLRGFARAERQQPMCFVCVIGSETASGVPRVVEVP